MGALSKIKPKEQVARLEEPQQEEAQPYVGAWKVSSGARPEKLPDNPKISGLDFFHLVEAKGDGWLLVSHWRSREAFERDGSRFAGAFEGAEPTFQGHLRSFEPGRKSLWKRLKLGTVILSIGALVGAVEVIYNRYDRFFDWFFGEASLRLDLQGPARLRYAQGAEIEEELVVTNPTSLLHRAIEIESALLRDRTDPGRTAALTAPETVERLQPSSSSELALVGTAPAPGRYELELTVSAKVGRWRGAGEFELTRPVEVWPKDPVIQGLRLVESGGGIAKVEGTVATGVAAPAGIECEILIQGFPGIELRLLNFRGAANERWNLAGGPGKEVFAMTWQGPGLDAFRTKKFQLFLAGPEATDWKGLVSAAQGDCGERLKEVAP